MASSQKKWPNVTSSHHRNRRCGPCVLCNKLQPRYDHFCMLKQSEQEFLQRHFGSEIANSSCLCRSHTVEAKRHRSDPEYIPAWKSSSARSCNIPCSSCMYPGCTVTRTPLGERLISPSQDTAHIFVDALKVEGDIVLCETHYQAVYRQSHKPDPCAGCGARPKSREAGFSRHSPDAITVSEYLRTETGSDCDISPSDILCKACYDAHLAILNSIEQQANEPRAKLTSNIDLWKEKMSDENTNELTRAVLATVIFVAKKLLQDRALLLPHAVSFFLDSYRPHSAEPDLYIESEYGKTKFSPRWLLNHLIVHLQPFMSLKCIIKRIGTLIYPRNSDPLKCLSFALHDTQSSQECSFEMDLCQSDSDQKRNVLMEAANIINDLIHNEIRKLECRKLDLTTFNLEESIHDTNDMLWSFIKSSTRSVRERTGRASNDDSHTKQTRQFFLICSMLFTTNSSSKISLHHLVADTVEVYGGSRYLIQVLNRLGVSVCEGTHDTHVTEVAEKQKAKSVWIELSPTTFTVASADNYDSLQRHAPVYCGGLARSYHGTTMQLVQPVPSLSTTGDIHTTAGVQSSVQRVTGSTTKRPISKSPSNSPHKLGKLGPKRRRSMRPLPKKAVAESSRPPQKSTSNPYQSLKIDRFSETNHETASRTKLHKELFSYFLQKFAIQASDSNKILNSFRKYILPSSAQLADSDPSVIHYMEVLDENADSKETMTEVSELLMEKLLSQSQQKWVVLVGDGKTYDHLRAIKRLYGPAFEKLLIFPGDWHTLKSFQPVIMKAYYHAGLKDIAKNSGYKAETLTSLEKCSHFKRTHWFLLQVWEALMMEMISAFAATDQEYGDLQKSIQDDFGKALTLGTSSHDVLLNVQQLVNEFITLHKFNQFVNKQAESDGTWKLWSNFVFKDCFSYVCLFLAIRMSNWDLRVASLKAMAPLFTAYDRPCYQKLIPYHLADIECWPEELLKCFRAGGFTVKVKGGVGHAVALDEAHEMCINRDLKMAIARPTHAYVMKMNFFFSYRIKAQNQLSSQLFPATKKTKEKSKLLDLSSLAKHWNENIMQMRSLISKHELLPVECSRGVINAFTGAVATPEQTHDLLNARTIGEQHYNNFINYHILQTPSTAAPLRKAHLLTMAPPKVTKRKLSQKEKESRETNKYLRRRLEWCNRTGQQFDQAEEQYSLYPRALVDPDGQPQKGAKSNWTDKLKDRYSTGPNTPFLRQPPWVPRVAIVDAMFPLNITPLRQLKTMVDYAHLLFKVAISPHFSRGISEVHLVFDHPDRLPFNPKDCEHNRRYGQSRNEHIHVTLTPQSPIPRPWREKLNCRKCKRAIVEALGWAYLRTAKHLLGENQVFVLAGCFSGESQDDAWIITGVENALPQATQQFRSNALEADMRVWRHALQCQHEQILVCSADTDVYNIGLVMYRPNKHYLVQINLPQADSLHVDMDGLLAALQHDPDLASLPQDQLGSIMLQAYIVTGCDYISYISGIGKATFLKVMFQHAEFITGEHSHGCLSQTNTADMNDGFYACVRLLGTAYFKKNLATMVCKLGFETPNQLFNSMDPSLPAADRVTEWYMSIKRAIRIVSEDQRPPTLTALRLHWHRASWVKGMWNNCSEENQYYGLPPPESQGWLKTDNCYSIQWEEPQTTQKIQAALDFLNKGCTCKTGCKTKRCSCQKKGRKCGAGCECKGCTNITLSQPSTHQEEEAGGDSEEEEAIESDYDTDGDSTSDEEDLQTEVVTDNFSFEDIMDFSFEDNMDL